MKFKKWWSKLNFNQFTTIRPAKAIKTACPGCGEDVITYGYYYVGRRCRIDIADKWGAFYAKVIAIRPIRKAEITEQLARSDADCSRAELIKFLEETNGKKTDDYILIILKKEKQKQGERKCKNLTLF